MYLSLATFLVKGTWPSDLALAQGNASVCHEMCAGANTPHPRIHDVPTGRALSAYLVLNCS